MSRLLIPLHYRPVNLELGVPSNIVLEPDPEEGAVLITADSFDALRADLADHDTPRFHVFDTEAEARAAYLLLSHLDERLARLAEVGTLRDGEGVLMVPDPDRPIEDDGFRSCFAHTPTGAVVAAANLAAMGSYAPLRPRFNREAIAPGPGRDAVLAKPLPQGGTDGVRLQLAGFRLLRYTGAQADLDLALLASTGQLFGATLFLEWAEGDWKARMGDDGSDLSSFGPISSLTGYVAWGADSG